MPSALVWARVLVKGDALHDSACLLSAWHGWAAQGGSTAAAATAVALQVDVTCPQMSLVVSGLCASSMPSATAVAGAEMELMRLCAMGTTVSYRTRPFDRKLTLALQSLQVQQLVVHLGCRVVHN
jgi:hypothetical protein